MPPKNSQTKFPTLDAPDQSELFDDVLHCDISSRELDVLSHAN